MSNEITAKAELPAQSTPESLPAGYADLLNDLKAEIRTAQIRARRVVNTEMICHYWRLGRLILDRQEREGWGAKVVQRLSTDLRTTFPSQRGLSVRSLQYMQRMAKSWPEPIVQQAVAQLPWGHITVLLDSLDDRLTRDFYAEQAVQHGWSRNVLSHMLSSQLHLRQGAAISNFDRTVPEGSDLLREITKDPYVLDFTHLGADHAERELEDALVDHVVKFLQELGVGFAFMGRQYPLQVGRQEFRMDLLFYHARLHRYVVIELKTGPAQPAHVGQLAFYIAVVNDKIRDPERDDETIGILIAADRDQEVVQYSLSGTIQPMAVSTYETLPPAMRELLPTEDDLARVTHEVLDEHRK
ncbi:hypothetical protein CFP65_4311 [Kitasatospora sp. MMS16-BH015]|uniref:PDDEXK nuclease domain-containing protein n=1 Tax=Kitasatospora sp. MMS16-BH015 TaxID=2018025 RepID=UPI000CA26548|nr:PDDEXK nuclease domain-containing protein [Kitasatospora sp. MMS16-BH015]AUG79062.1 hypothetical protein CFP65_4311 [Kitasatospora sp. MMS16-BH015]